MKLLIRGAALVEGQTRDIFIEDGRIEEISHVER